MRRNGFTLAEVTIVIGLLGILVALGTAFSSSYLSGQYLRSAGETVIAELRRAQTESTTQSNDLSHGIKVLEGSVVRFAGETYASRTASLDATTAFSADVTVAGNDEIDIPEGASGPVTTTTVTIERSSAAIDITITPYGVLTVTERTIGH